MIARTWYLGPTGDLRALTVPQPGFSVDTVRYGGTHQGLSGARVTDVLGFRQQFKFTWENLEYSEWSWLEALYLRLVPGPFYLNSPLKKNLLSPQASVLDFTTVDADILGVSASRAPTREWDWPGTLSVPGRSLKFVGTTDPNTIAFDGLHHTGVLIEPITGSVYMKAESAVSVDISFNMYDRDGEFVDQLAFESSSVTTSWQRFDLTATPDPGTRVKFVIDQPGSSVDLWIAAPQVEYGSTATSWEIGGGSVCVILDQMSTTSPLYPQSNVELTLLEA